MAKKQSWWNRLWHGLDPVPPPSDEPAPPPAHDQQLEDEIAHAPEAIDPYLVYADWLQERGDPRGTLISLQARCTPRVDEQRGNEIVRTLEPWRVLDGEHAQAARDLIARFPIQLGGDLGRNDHAEWFCGYWRRLRIVAPTVKEMTQRLTEHLAGLLGHPSARFLRSLSLGSQESCDLFRHLPQLPPTVHTFHLDEPTFPVDDAYYLGKIAPLMARAPGLERLVLQARCDVRDRIDLPRLRSLELVSKKLDGYAMRAIAASELPALETLILWIGGSQHSWDIQPADVHPLFASPRPNLRELALVRCSFLDDIVAELVAAPWAPQLRSLDLKQGGLTTRGVAILEAARARLASIERIDVAGNPLDADAVQRVAALTRRM